MSDLLVFITCLVLSIVGSILLVSIFNSLIIGMRG